MLLLLLLQEIKPATFFFCLPDDFSFNARKHRFGLVSLLAYGWSLVTGQTIDGQPGHARFMKQQVMKEKKLQLGISNIFNLHFPIYFFVWPTTHEEKEREGDNFLS